MSNTLIISFQQPQPNNLGASLAFASPPVTSPKCGQAKNRWRVQIMTKKVVACLAICTRSGGEPASGSFCCWGQQTERKTLPTHNREKRWHLSPQWLIARRRFSCFTRCSRWAGQERVHKQRNQQWWAAMKAGTVCVAARWCLVGNVSWWFCLQVFVTGLRRVGVCSPPARLQL